HAARRRRPAIDREGDPGLRGDPRPDHGRSGRGVDWVTISLTLACGGYDRTLPLALGDVRPAGIDLTYLRLHPHPEAIFWRMSHHQEFDVAEMSLSSYLLGRSRGDDSLEAIPVFPSRFFRHGSIYVNSASGIQ